MINLVAEQIQDMRMNQRERDVLVPILYMDALESLEPLIVLRPGALDRAVLQFSESQTGAAASRGQGVHGVPAAENDPEKTGGKECRA